MCPVSDLLVLRIAIPELDALTTFKALRDCLVGDLLFAILKKKRMSLGEGHALYLVPNKRVECGVWLDEGQPLWVYELYDHDLIECRRRGGGEGGTDDTRQSYIKVVFPEQLKTKTLQVDRSMLVRDALQLVSQKLDVFHAAGADLRFYGLFALLNDGSVILLQDDVLLSTYSLGNMSIVEFKKKDIIVLSIFDPADRTMFNSSQNSFPSMSAASSSSLASSYSVPTTPVSITFSTKATIKEIIADLSPWLESQIKKRTINYKLLLCDPKLWLIENNPISSYNIKKNDKLYLFPKVDDNLNHDEGFPKEDIKIFTRRDSYPKDYLHGRPGGMEGDLYMTNYQLKFFSKENNSEHNIPLYAIARIEKVGKSKSTSSCYLDLHCKDFRFVRLQFPSKNGSRKKLYQTMKGIVFPGAQTKTFAFYNKEEYPIDGWKLYSVEQEFRRMGVVPGTVPERITDEQLDEVFAFRSRGRIPALSWRHSNGATITRCSQPLVGITRTRCYEDEQLFREIGARDKPLKPRHSTTLADLQREPKNLYVLDARPKANALGNRAIGAGYENTTTCYPGCIIEFLNIGNIHVMRDSLEKVKETCFAAVGGINGQYIKDQKADSWLSGIDNSHWLDHIRLILEGAVQIVEIVHNMSLPVLIHCSDGWDRTSQLSAVSMLLLDPYYRTLEGFIVLIEKEWLSFGHKFAQRMGHGDAKHGDEQRSPVFLQFIESIYQILCQFPKAIEFNERLLLDILQHLFSCRFGTFLFNCERERMLNNLHTTTVSLWSHVLSNRDKYVNPLYSRDEKVLKLSLAIPLFSVWKNYYLQNLLPTTDTNLEMQALHKEIKRLQAENEKLRNLSTIPSFSSSTASLPSIRLQQQVSTTE
eukprot:gene18609-22269_t